MIIFCNPLDADKLNLIESKLSMPYQVIPMIQTMINQQADWIEEVNEAVSNWAVTSKKAVEALLAHKSELRFPDIIYCVGPGTARMLEQYHLPVSYPSVYSSDELAKHIMQNNETSILHIKGNLAGESLADSLSNLNIKVTGIEVYKTVKTPALVQKESISALVFMSPSAVESFLELNTDFNSVPTFCIGPTTADSAELHGFQQIFLPASSTFPSLLERIIQYFND